MINEALEEYEGGVRRAARRLGMSRMGMSRTGLYKRIRILGVPLPSSEQGQADDSGGRD